MLGELSFAVRRDRDAAAYRESLEEALDSARRLKELTEDLLALARVGAPHQERQPVRLSEVSAAAATSTRDAAESRGVKIEVAPSEAVVDGHPGDLERLLRNLLENAARHGKPPIRPDDAKLDAKGTIHLFFPRSSAITLDDKDVTFEVRFGSLSVTKKFRLKDMVYKGELAL